MQKPTPRETLPRLLELGIITPDQKDLLLANYEYFEQNRPYIEQTYPGKWVASLDNELLIGSSLEEVQQLIEGKKQNRLAYIKQVV